MKKPLVAVIMGSDSDMEVAKGAADILVDLSIPYKIRILSAHRTPDILADFVQHAHTEGVKIFICIAGWAAHLAGAVAANTLLPVIGVPVASSSLAGLDALLSTVQMPKGIPVATMAIGVGGAKNAALYAARILALSDEQIAKRLEQLALSARQTVLKKDKELSGDK
ncbi:MAG: 5-(carboxyamino)imidazole ribonucleotide mutase [Planctomycetota bacterium]